MKHTKKQQRGFTLVELAIVLVIIGLILGMAFKGKDLIDGAKVKTIRAQYDKILTGFNIYYERNSRYPGDGCTSATPANLAACTNTRNGVLDTDNEFKAALHFLKTGNILSNNELTGPQGVEWGFRHHNNRTWASLASTDSRFICALDQQMDDGVHNTGTVRMFDHGTGYDKDTDCWNRDGIGRLDIALLP